MIIPNDMKVLIDGKPTRASTINGNTNHIARCLGQRPHHRYIVIYKKGQCSVLVVGRTGVAGQATVADRACWGVLVIGMKTDVAYHQLCFNNL